MTTKKDNFELRTQKLGEGVEETPHTSNEAQ